MNLAHLLERQALRAPERPALLSGSQVVASHGEWAASAAALARRLRIACFKRPKRYLVVDELPKNACGKVLKTVLREQLRRP